LVRALWDRLAQKEEVLFVDFDDQWLEDFKAQDAEAIPEAFRQLTCAYPPFMFSVEVQRLSTQGRSAGSPFDPLCHIAQCCSAILLDFLINFQYCPVKTF
jgi:hypothetical protein